VLAEDVTYELRPPDRGLAIELRTAIESEKYWHGVARRVADFTMAEWSLALIESSSWKTRGTMPYGGGPHPRYRDANRRGAGSALGKDRLAEAIDNRGPEPV
jgi:hypothetical protein